MQAPKRFAFPPLRKVADLIHKGRPLLSHLMSESGEHYLFHWLEGDLLQNRWLACRVRLEQLLKYTDRKISLQSVFLAPADGFLYLVETDNGSDLQYRNVQLVFPGEIPAKQLPPKDSFYKGTPQSQPLDLMDVSKKYDSGLLQIHFSASPKIGYGTIDLSLLAPALNHIYEMAEGLGHSHYKRQADNKHLPDKFSKEDNKRLIISASSYELVNTMPGSFNVILRPRNQQLPMIGQESEADKFSRYWHDFIAASFDFEKLASFATKKMDSRVVASYQNLLKLVRTSRLHLHLRWANYYTQLQWQQSIDHQQATHILENINQLEYLTDNSLRLTGKFVALNVRSNMYVFESDDGREISRGYIATALHHGVPLLFFSRKYEVVIQRIEMKQAGKPKPRTKDLLIAFTEANLPNRALFRLENGLFPGQEPL